MKLSLIIVNHNACSRLKQALISLINGSMHFDCEFIVADNASTDGSVAMLRTDFPQVQVIAGENNRGISKAANQAIRATSGEYISLTGPDIMNCKDSLEKMIAFMDTHKSAGGLGVRMLSPQGRFLPESIYGLTKPWKVFFKLIGFNKYFSKTRLNNPNYKEWVEEFQTAEVDIVNSGCMLLRRSALNQIGLFDERFAHVGYNIDLSYRLRIAGYKNYYFPKTYMISLGASEAATVNWNNINNTLGAMLVFAIKYLIRVPEIKVQDVALTLPSSFEVK
jgi:GT2 family glycosyltransferase